MNSEWSSNPIHQGDDGLWYFWDETWSQKHGPFDSELECIQELNIYVYYLEYGLQQQAFQWDVLDKENDAL